MDCKLVFLSVKLDLDCWKLRRRIHRNCLNEVTKKNIYYTFDVKVRDRNRIVLSLVFSLTNKSTHISVDQNIKVVILRRNHPGLYN